MKKIIFIITMLIGTQTINAQENDEWKARMHLTGYIALEGEYINGLDALHTNYGVGISEAGLLFNYKPLEKLEIKSVFVYRPGHALDLSFVEINANYKFTDAFGVQAGRFNTPVSPTNYYFYAPMNLGTALPMQSTHHLFYPQSVEGININGDLNIGKNSVLKYNIFGGGYFQVEHQPIGVLRFHGRENAFLLEEYGRKIDQFAIEGSRRYYPGGGGRLSLDVGDFLTVGANSFIMEKKLELYSIVGDSMYMDENISTEGIQQSYGGDIKLSAGNLTIKSEYWISVMVPDDKNYKTMSGIGYYGELSYAFEKITPFIKYEYSTYDIIVAAQPSIDIGISRSTIGINYRPMFETMFKLEYHRYTTNIVDFDAVMFSLVYSF